MKLYDFPGAPNPRRVRMFLAEKDVAVELVSVDLAGGEHRSAEFLKKNPSAKIPVLELDDGTCIAESVAICRYIEAEHPQPNLFGATAVELGLIEMGNRHIELELLSQIGISWVNGPIVARIAEVVALCRSEGWHLPISNQPLYNLYRRDIEAAVVPTSLREGLGQLVYSPLAQGVLTGKYLPGAPPPAGTRMMRPPSFSAATRKYTSSPCAKPARSTSVTSPTSWPRPKTTICSDRSTRSSVCTARRFYRRAGTWCGSSNTREAEPRRRAA